MKSKNLGILMLSFFLSAPIFATEDSDSSTSTDSSTSNSCSVVADHNRDRAIAFGSVLLNAHFNNMDSWKSIFAEPVMSTLPVPALSAPRARSASCVKRRAVGNEDRKYWSVAITTQYTFEECPNGEAIIHEKGIGVELTSPTEGEFYEWVDVLSCASGPLGKKEIGISDIQIRCL